MDEYELLKKARRDINDLFDSYPNKQMIIRSLSIICSYLDEHLDEL